MEPNFEGYLTLAWLCFLAGLWELWINVQVAGLVAYHLVYPMSREYEAYMRWRAEQFGPRGRASFLRVVRWSRKARR